MGLKTLQVGHKETGWEELGRAHTVKSDVKRGPRNSGPCLPNEETGAESSVGSQKNDSSCMSH